MAEMSSETLDVRVHLKFGRVHQRGDSWQGQVALVLYLRCGCSGVNQAFLPSTGKA
jgi:hypothetical protein